MRCIAGEKDPPDTPTLCVKRLEFVAATRMSSYSSGVAPSGRSSRRQILSGCIAASGNSPGKIMNDQRRCCGPIVNVTPGCSGSQNCRIIGKPGRGFFALASITSQS